MYKAKIETENRRLQKIKTIVSQICMDYSVAVITLKGKPYKHYINQSDDIEFYRLSLNEIVYSLKTALPQSYITTIDLSSSLHRFKRFNAICIVIELPEIKPVPGIPIFDKDRMRHSVGDSIKVVGYSQVHTITGVTSVGYSTRYTDFYESRPVEMTVSHVPFALVL